MTIVWNWWDSSISKMKGEAIPSPHTLPSFGAAYSRVGHCLFSCANSCFRCLSLWQTGWWVQGQHVHWRIGKGGEKSCCSNELNKDIIGSVNGSRASNIRNRKQFCTIATVFPTYTVLYSFPYEWSVTIHFYRRNYEGTFEKTIWKETSNPPRRHRSLGPV